jgi:hypothetical protein
MTLFGNTSLVEPPIDPPVEPPIEPVVEPGLEEPPLEPADDLVEGEPVEVPVSVPAAPAAGPQEDAGTLEHRFKAETPVVVAKAQALAAAVKDKASAEVALAYAVEINDHLKRRREYFDPRVARARQPYQDWLDAKSAACDPLEEAKEILTGKHGAVTKWQAEERDRARREQERLQREADERARIAREEEQRRAREQEEEARRQREQAEEARRAGDAEAAAELSRQARATSEAAAETRQAALAIEAPVIEVKAETPQVAGARTGRSRWDYAITDFEQFFLAAARPRILRELLATLKANGAERPEATAGELLSAIDFMESQCPDISLTLFQENSVTLRARANADRDTVTWPGVKFHNPGSTTLGGRKNR